MKSIWKNSFFNMVYKLTSLLFPLISSAYVSRILLPSGVGKVAAAQNVVSYFAIIAAFGLYPHGVREISKVRFEQKELNKTYSELFLINFLSTTVAIVAYFILIFSVNHYKQEIWLYLACGLQLLFNYLNIDWLYGGEEDYFYTAARSMTIKVISIIALFIFVKTKSDYITYAVISSCALGMNYIFNIIHSRKYVSLVFKELNLKRHISPLFVLFFTVLLTNIYSQIDITMLELLSTEYAVGLYSNAHKIIGIIVPTIAAITTVFLPRLSYCYKFNYEEFSSLLAKGMRLLSFLTLPVSVGLFLLTPQCITVMYGDAFIAGATTLRIFTILIIIRCFGDLLSYQLAICTGNEKKRLPMYFVAVIINITLNRLLIPDLAQNGAAIASVASEAISNLLQIVIMKKIIKYKFEWIAVWKSLIASGVMALSVIMVLHIFNNTLIQILFSVIIGGLVFVIVSLALKNETANSIMDIVKIRIKRR